MSRDDSALAFAFGAFATVAQVILLREILVILSGNELSLAFSLATWLIGVGFGASMGGLLADRKTISAHRLVLLGALLLVFVVPIAVLVLRLTRDMIGVLPGSVVPPFNASLVCLLLLSPSAFGVGLSFAPLSRMGPDTQKIEKKASFVYAMEALGAFFGGLFFSLVLAGRVPSLLILLGSCFAIMAVYAFVFIIKKCKSSGALCALLGSLFLFSIVSGFGSRLGDWSAEKRWQSYGNAGELIDRRESAYQLLEISNNDGQFDLYSNGSPLYSFPDPYERIGPIHVAMTQAGIEPKRVLLIGGGAADRISAVLEHEPEHVDYVSTDPEEYQIAFNWLSDRDRSAVADSRVRLITTDGRNFLRQARRGFYDVIIVETADPMTARTNRFYTIEFLEDCKNAVSPQGVLATKISVALNFSHTDVGSQAAILFRDLTDVFGNVALWPDSTIRMYASPQPGVVTEDAEILASRWTERAETIENFSQYRFESYFDETIVPQARENLANIQTVSNRDGRPISYLYGLVLWDQRARGNEGSSLLLSISKINFLWFFLPIVVVILVRIVHPRKNRKFGGDGFWATFIGGFCGLSLEVLLLFIFQNSAGSLYQSLGILVALFMGGLALGTILSERYCSTHNNLQIRRFASLIDVFSIILITIVLLLTNSGNFLPIFTGLILFLSGASTGFIFPPAVIDLRSRWKKGVGAKSAGLADASDHFGACLGAIFVGLILLPTGGVLGVVLFLVGTKCVSLVGWLRKNKEGSLG